MLTGLIVSVAVVAPEIFPPSTKFTIPFLHWYVKLLPVAETVKLAELPTHAVWLVGSVMIIGGKIVEPHVPGGMFTVTAAVFTAPVVVNALPLIVAPVFMLIAPLLQIIVPLII